MPVTLSHLFKRSLPLFLLALASVLFGSCTDDNLSGKTALEQIRSAGVLTVYTRNTPSTYFEDRTDPTGFEYELAQGFAEQLGVRLELVSLDTIDQLFERLGKNRLPALIAAGLTATTARESMALFTEGYLDVVPQIIYNTAHKQPRSAKDLPGKRILVLKDSIHADRLKQLQDEFPKLTFDTSDEVESVDLLRMVDEKQIDITLVNSNELAMHQVYFPHIQLGFSLEPSIELRWALSLPRKPGDHSLLDAANEYLTAVRKDKRMQQLIERYYGHLDVMGYVGANAFAKHLQQRMPKYETLFRKHAQEYGLDWRLLAAVGYQESHWDPQARSKTGVRGLMMLTQRTAQELGVKDRLDPAQSIQGGAKYIAQMLERLPDSIHEQDRFWFALAAYNVGLGHLEDARKLTQKAGLDPDSWKDVRSILPRLSQKRWYSQTRYGFARGGEPVHFVNNIRRYLDILTWSTQPLQEEGVSAGGSTHKPGIKSKP